MAAVYTVDQTLQVNDYYSKVIRAFAAQNKIQAILKRGETPKNWKQQIEAEAMVKAFSNAAPEGTDFDESKLTARTNLMLEVQLQKFRSTRGYFVTEETTLMPGYTQQVGEKELARAKRKDAEEVARSIEFALGSEQEAVERGTGASVVPKTRGMLSWLSNSAHSVQAINSALMPTCGISGDVTDTSVFNEDLFHAELVKAALETGDADVTFTILAGLQMKTIMSGFLGKAKAVTGFETMIQRTEPKSRKLELICDEFVWDGVRARAITCNTLGATIGASGTEVAQSNEMFYNAAVIRPEFWSIDTLKSLTAKDLVDKGAGPRGYHEAILRLACRMPKGQFAIKHTASASH